MPIREFQHQGLHHSASIHILDDDSLLNIFYFCRPTLLDGDNANKKRIIWGDNWVRERWWYKVAQVCRKWRCLLLGSATYLGLCHVCTYDTPVADVLAHSPPLPLTIDYGHRARGITADDEEGIILALQHRDRVRRIRLQMPVPILRKLTLAMDGEFPALEYLYISPRVKHDLDLLLPITFQAPHIRHLVLINFAFPIRSPLLMTSAALVTLSLGFITPSTFFRPHDLLTRLSLMPQLETLRINFQSVYLSYNVESGLSPVQIMQNVTFPNLRWFGFGGESSYLEALLPHMTTPVLERLQITYSNKVILPVPCLLQFMDTTENLRLSHARLVFDQYGFSLTGYPYEAKVHAFYVSFVRCFAWPLSSTIQYFNILSPVLSAVVDLSLGCRKLYRPSQWYNEREHWRALLRSFSNVRTLRIPKVLIWELPRVLLVGDGELPTELLPELKVIECPASRVARDALVPFIDARRAVGRVVTVASRSAGR